jgi:hypothetical protein
VRLYPAAAFFCLSSILAAQQSTTSPSTALTIYNDDFAVARTFIPLDLHPGANDASTTDVTSRLEPDSVVLRDPSGKQTFRVVEQNYDAGIITVNRLLQMYEGKTINFQVRTEQGFTIVPGKIIRAPREIPRNQEWEQYQQFGQAPDNQPLIEVNGQMQFELPGTPLFPVSSDGLLLKPTLHWQLDSEKAQHLSAELAYITSGLSWEATYNIVAPNSGDTIPAAGELADLTGLVTIHNLSGTDFPAARIKLMAGEFAKIQPPRTFQAMDSIVMAQATGAAERVTQKDFDDFHLYDLNRTVSLLNGETKQIQFISAPGITLSRSYRYEGAASTEVPHYGFGNINSNRDFGISDSNPKVQIIDSFKNSEANHLGMPLPAGRIRLYRRDTDGQMEFVGESIINHTPTEDTVKIVTGSAFDIKGARRQTDFHVNQGESMLDESFEIRLTNQKSQPVTVSVLEHLNRGDNWEITHKSADFDKLDSHTIEFPIQVPAKGEATLTYSVRYTW